MGHQLPGPMYKYTYPFYWASEVCIVIGRACIMKLVYLILIFPHALEICCQIHPVSVC